MGILCMDTSMEAVIEREKSVYCISIELNEVVDQLSLTFVVQSMWESGIRRMA